MKKESSLGFNELLIEAINNLDLDFVKKNVERIYFAEPNNNGGFEPGIFNENSIFQNLIINGFTEGFKVIFDYYITKKTFYPYMDRFHYIIISTCHYSKPEILSYIMEKVPFDLGYHDVSGASLIHHVFEGFGKAHEYASDQDITDMILWLQKNGVNIYEPHPATPEYSEGLNMSLLRKYHHSIFSYLIVKDKFNIALDVFPEGKNFNIFVKNKKSKETINLLYKHIYNEKIKQEENINKLGKFSTPYIHKKNIPEADFHDQSSELFVKILEHSPEFVMESITDHCFLFQLFDLDFIFSTNEGNKNYLFNILISEERKNEKLYCALAWLIKENFTKNIFFDKIKNVSEKYCNLYEQFSKNTQCVDAIVSAFQAQKRPPDQILLNLQFNFFTHLSQDVFNEKQEYLDGMCYFDLVRATIQDWEEDGFLINHNF